MQLLINVLVAGDGHMNTLLCMQVKLVRLRSVLRTDVRETYLHVSQRPPFGRNNTAVHEQYCCTLHYTASRHPKIILRAV